jgi:hypothetical protein
MRSCSAESTHCAQIVKALHGVPGSGVGAGVGAGLGAGVGDGVGAGVITATVVVVGTPNELVVSGASVAELVPVVVSPVVVVAIVTVTLLLVLSSMIHEHPCGANAAQSLGVPNESHRTDVSPVDD